MSAVIIRFPRQLHRAIFIETLDGGRTWRWHIRSPDGKSHGLRSEWGDKRIVISDAHDWSRRNGLPVLLLGVSGHVSVMRRRA